MTVKLGEFLPVYLLLDSNDNVPILEGMVEVFAVWSDVALINVIIGWCLDASD